jgi:hypothetical protein
VCERARTLIGAAIGKLACDNLASPCRDGADGPLAIVNNRSTPVSIKKPALAASSQRLVDGKLDRALGQRRDTSDNEKWSGRWESNPSGQVFKAYEMRHFVKRRRLHAIGVRIFTL